MANKVTITMNNVPAGLDSMYVRVEEDALTAGVRNVLHSGVQAVTGNTIDINIGENGTVGNGAIISADNHASGGAAFKSMTGYALIEAGEVAPPNPEEFSYDNIVFVGASIMNGAFGQSLTVPNANATTYLNNGTNVYGYGWSGEKYAAIRPKILEALAAFEGTKTLFVIHAFGNNISGDRPLANNDATVKQEWNDMLDDVYAITDAVRGDCIIADPTFRNYDGTTLYDIDQGSFPYIGEYFTPRRNARFTNTDGSCILDLHTMVRENNGWLLPDGIHIDDNVSFRAGILDRLRYLTDGTGVKPDPIVQTIPLDDPSKPPATPTDTVIVNFGTLTLSDGFQGTSLTAEAFNAHNTRRLKTGQGFYTEYTMKTFSIGANAGNNTSGRTLSTPYNDTLISDPLHSNCIYIPEEAELTFSGFDANQVVEVSFIATKSDYEDYLTRMEEKGNPSNFAEYNSSQVSPAAPTPISITADSNGVVSVLIKEVNFRNAYLGAVRINPLP